MEDHVWNCKLQIFVIKTDQFFVVNSLKQFVFGIKLENFNLAQAWFVLEANQA